jgi:hypothetical protein
MKLDYSTVNGSGRIVFAVAENEPDATEPTIPGTGGNAPTGDFSVVVYVLLALSSACGMGVIFGKKKF